ncbi:hypothetical protein L2D01_03875 [Hyphomonadaceae bacterium ML37]|nr:hypothetical protein L2D01_03875 [Hyphomonadaceae bacterium ML37]
MIKAHPGSTRAGLTLAELLVALFVSALALGICAEGVRRALTMHGAIERGRIEREAVSAGLGAARERLERAVPLTGPGPAADSSRLALFHGVADGLIFVAADPGYPSTAGLYEYRITVESADGLLTLTLTRRPLLDVAGFNEDGSDRETWPLAVIHSAARFAYAGPDLAWREEWRDEPVLPALVRITMDGSIMIARLPAAPSQPEPAPAEAGDAEQPPPPPEAEGPQ